MKNTDQSPVSAFGSLTRLKPKMTILVGSMLAAFGVYAALAGGISNSQLAALKDTTSRFYPLLQATDSSLFVFERLKETLNAAAAARDLDELSKADSYARLIEANFTDSADRAPVLAGDIAALRAEFDTYYRTARKVSEKLAAGAHVSEVTTEVKAMAQMASQFGEHVKTFHERRLQDFTATIKGLETDSNRLRSLGIILVGSAIAIFGAIMLALNRGIVRPIETLSTLSQRVARGEFPNVPQVNTRDEISVLCRNFGQMVREIKLNQRNTQKLAILSRLVGSETTLAGLIREISTAIPEVLDLSARCTLYFSSACFIDLDLPVGLYHVDTSGKNPTPTPKAALEAAGDRIVWVEDLQSGEHVAAVHIEASDDLLKKHAPQLQSIGINIAHALNAIRLAGAMTLLEKKSQEMMTIFTTIAQGIVVIDGNGRIGREYSKFTERLLEEADLGGKNIDTLLFKRSSLSHDAAQKALAACDNTVGENSVNFRLNRDNLPRDLAFNAGKQPLQLELDWAPLAGSDDQVVGIMLTIRDVTEVRSLRESARKRSEDSEILKQIFDVSPRRFASFRAMTAPALSRTRHALANLENQGLDGVQAIARDLHTIKGNSRTLGLSLLSEAMHELETAYFSLNDDTLMAHDSKSNVDQKLSRVERIFKQYVMINDDKLRRVGDLGGAMRSTRILRLVAKAKDEHRPPTAGELETLAALLTRGEGTALVDLIRDVVHGVADGMRPTRQQPPKLILEGDQQVQVSPDDEGELSAIMTHLVRNALDHGLERHPDGQIAIRFERASDGIVKLEFSDSGPGLNLIRLRELGRERGLLTPDAADEATAELIFISGLSTKREVTEISGRGVGMDAVKATIRNLGGDIRVVFTGPGTSDGYRPFQFVVTFGPQVTTRSDSDGRQTA